jgi:valyl-tRNA synthetase
LPKTYDPRSVEPEIRALWGAGDHELFRADASDEDRPPFVIVIPPPNVTGALHGGHALNNTLQDILVRWHRMRGFNTLWLPGTDHAGIATQAVVERSIFESEKKTRHDLGREELVRRIWEWKEAFGNRIVSQLELMGCSCDWSRLRFTLDDVCARAVRATFFSLFRDGLIVRGKRLVNWDTHLQTAVADDEVYHERVKGSLWHVRYPLAEPVRLVREGREVEVGHLVVATTRPETMLGDTAVAVHPDDERWRALVGKTVILPLMEREIPIIADPMLVDVGFGTGCVKVTPAHDPNDYECGLRHGLPMINVLTPDGRINESGGAYRGMERFEARRKIVEDLEEAGLVEKIEDHIAEVGHSDRSKTPIEPYLSDQWFVRMGDLPPEEASRIEGLRGAPGLAQLAMDAVSETSPASVEERRDSGRVHFFPERYAKTYLDWLSEKRDWCISRQLWWGHRIPIWFCETATEEELRKAFEGRDDVVWRRDDETDRWLVCSRAEDLASDAVPGHELTQDPDVLDTWFSSALWPHSTLGWPEETGDLERFYPGNVLSTAREIITLWVARMVLTGLYNMGRVPFPDVVIHPVIQDAQGRPFKKTLGNGFDPVDIIDAYGADALRFTMASLATETQDIRMPTKRIETEDGREIQTSDRFEQGRNFCNKIWNAARFAFMNLEGARCDRLEPKDLPIEDRWILSRVSHAAREVQEALSRYQFSRAVNLAREFFWDALCDWYLELVKARLAGGDRSAEARQVLAFVLDQALRLLHPCVPFITERLWRTLGEIAPERGLPGIAEADTRGSLSVASYPPTEGWPTLDDPELEAVFDDLRNATRAVRDIRARQGVPPKEKVDVIVKVPAARVRSMEHESRILLDQARIGELRIDPEAERPKNSATTVVGDMQIFVLGVIDAEAERARLEKELAGIEKQIASVAAKLGNENFVSRAKPEIVERERNRLSDLRAKRNAVAKAMEALR